MALRDLASDFSARAGGALSGFREKLSGGAAAGRGNDRNNGYDEYGYDEYGYEDTGSGNGAYNPYDNPYDEYSYNYEEDSPRGGSSRSGGRVSYPSLVTADDIRANTQASERARREGAGTAGRRSYSSNRVSVGYSDEVSDEAPAPVKSEAGRSKGYDSLFTSTSNTVSSSTPIEEVSVSSRPAGFTSTAKPTSAAYVSSVKAGATSSAASSAAASTVSFDPYAAYQGSGSTSYTSARNLKVLVPAAYGDVESIARTVKVGDVVVLNLAEVDGDLSKRVLDFSFGVASALDARVDCVGNKVFAISKGAALTSEETEKLKTQGVL